MRSESINELAAALAKAQAEIEPPKKTRTATVEHKNGTGRHSYDYSDLADLIAAIRGPFSKHGLAFTQVVQEVERDTVLVTLLIHTSGQWLESRVLLPQGGTPQAFGSALTYMRRYCLGPLAGVASEDDDDAGSAEASGSIRPSPKPSASPVRPNGPQAVPEPAAVVAPHRPPPTKEQAFGTPVPHTGELKDYVMQIGRYRGKRFREVNFIDLNAYVAEVHASMEGRAGNPALTVKEFLEMAKAYLDELMQAEDIAARGDKAL